MTDIATNTSGIATNVTDIATNTSGIATNVTDIATNTSGIATNVTDIATNTSGIATNVTDIATNTSGIATNVTDIATNTSGIATNVTDIATNTSGIATNVTDIATNVTDIATNTSGIATNVTDIATNTSGIATNVTDIATNTSGIATNVTDIATNTSGIATNVTDIATNTSGITTNVTDIATNTSGIATNVTDIATNTSGIATNVTDITTNTSGIATNVTDIATNTSGIATNVTDIATNTSGIATNVTDIATNTSGIATNVTDIATNTSGIATNVTDIATNTSGITTNVTDIATNTSGIATNVTDIATNTSGIATNVTDIATNTSGIATNVTDIATNTSGIATNVTDIATNTSGIATNVTDIATNTSGIATNVTDIATNTSGIATNVTDITTNTSGIATNVTDIATNTSGIATNVTDIATNTSGIATNVTDIATNTSGIATNLTDIATNTSGIATNVTDIATNTSGIATNVTDIATNISGIATNVTDIATNTSGIATNETDIATNSSGIATNVTDIATNTSGIATNVTDIATKITGNNAIIAGTNTKITYDTKGLVTAGSAATTADIDASTNRNYVTDAEATVIGNTSGTNTGDQTLSGLGGVAGNSAITAGTNTKITYDAKGLVTAGSAATTADIDASTDRNYVTDAEATVIDNTSGTNTGDQTAAQVVSTATGAIVATNVDSAIAELEAKKLALAGGEMTGNITMNGTETVDGRDLSVDGAKLDGIAAGAQVNVSGDSGNAAVYDNSGTPTLKSGITKTEIQTLINVEDGADVTDATNVLAAGALMDSEVTDLAGVKAVTISTLQVKPSEGAFADGDKTKLDGIAAGAQVNVSGDSGNAAVYDNSGTPTLKSGITKTEIQTLINVEDGADVTDATNVLAAGALMDSEVTDLAGVKAVTISTLQVKPSEGAFADGDKTKLDGIAAGAQVNVSGDSGNAAVYDNSGTPTLKSGITKTEIQTLINVEDGADVTDATNVLAAGALMDSEVTDLAGVKAVTISTLQVKPSEGAFADGDKTKLDGIAAGAQVNVSGDSGNAAVYDNSGTPTLKSGITKTEIQTLINVEDGADVTDATNVLAAGALMDSEVTDLAGVKAVTISTLQVKPSEGAFADGDKTKLDGIAAGAQVNVSGDSGNAAVYDNSGTPTLKSGITKTEIQTLINVEDGADVTDATNVLAAGALMDSEVTDLAGVKAVTISTLQVKPSEGAFADGDKTKLDGIAAGAQVNVSGDSGNAAVYDNSGTPTLKSGITKTEIQTLINVEDGADVTDATNVLAAGALMDSEVTDLAGVKAVTISTLQVKPSEGAFADGDKTKLDGIAAGAQVNVSGDSGNAAVYDNSGTPTLKSGITKTEIQTLINVEDGADVTDATNVLAAGALMDSEVTDLAGVKAVTISTLQVKPSEGAFADGDKTKLDGIAAGAQVNVSGDSGNAAVYDNSGTPTLKSGITKTEIQTLINVEDGADVTDATNVLAAGALMDSEVTDLAGVKAVTISTLQVKPSEGAFADGDKTKLDGIAAGAQVNVSGDSGNAAVYDNSGTPTLKSGITKTEIQTLINVEDGADVTDATNVLAAGALMDSEVTDLAGVKAVTISTLQVKPSEGAFADGDKTKLDGIAAGAQVNVSGDSGNAAVYDNSGTPTLKSGITKTEIQTLINVEDGADVTDATNVLAAGALMDSEVTDLAGVKAVTISTLQVKPSEGAFADGDKTKLDGIAAGAQVNVSGDSGNAAVYDNSGTPTLKSGITKTEIQTLINVEDGADVTDATNVLAAGALMDSEVTDLAGVKAVTISTLQVKPSEGAFADGDKTKLDGIAAGAQVNVSGDSGNAAVYDNSGTPTLKSGITKTEIQTLINVEDGADVTDATNVLAAGALMDSEVTDLAGVKAVTISTLQVKPSEGAFADGDKTKLDGIAAGAQVNVSGDSGNAAVYDNSGTPTLKSGITKTEIQTLINVEDGADVTDATNVLAAGAVMTTGDQTIADSKTFSSTIVGDINGNAATATKIASITNSDIVQLTETQTLTNKTLTSPTITGTGAIAGTFTGDITGDVTGNADTVTDNRPTSDALADISAVGSEYNSTSNIGSGEREFVTGFGITFNTFEAGIDISTESVVMIIPIEPAYSTVSSIDLPMQLIVTIDATNAANDTFTLNTWNGGGFSAPNVNFKFKFLVFK